MMGPIVGIKEAIALLRRRKELSTESPLIVCVHSCARDAGKTYFSAAASNELHVVGKHDVHTSTTPVTDTTLRNRKTSLDYYFYDAGVSTPSASLRSSFNDAVQPVFGRNIDVFTYVFNPRHTPHSLEQLKYVRNIYDIVVMNPHNDRK